MEGTPQPEGSRLFVRRSTGLVREASALDATIFNAVFSAPVGATLAIGVLWALSAFPGADPVWATIIAVVLNIPVLIMMALLASSMPRTGGDYVWVSRILSPPLAMISNFAAALSAMIGATFWARFFPVFALDRIYWDGELEGEELRAHRSRKAIAHRSQAAGREHLPRIAPPIELRGPHLMLTDVRGDERIPIRQFIELLDDELRLDDMALTVVLEAIARAPKLNLRPPRLECVLIGLRRI